jgi:7-carboxy-7-deazaguanine synthase (Cx14CxxC type)
MTYAVKELFYSVQGEGANAGRPAVFCRFAGCNLWSGREEDRATAVCQFCDTEFVGTDGTYGGRYTAPELAEAIEQLCRGENDRLVVVTGGEPLLQLDEELIAALHARRFEIAVETNGTVDAPRGIDWLCVSPKAHTELRVRCGAELKLVYPQTDLDPETFTSLAFEHFFLQPMDGAAREENTRRALDYCLSHPRWRLSIQTHKYLGVR